MRPLLGVIYSAVKAKMQYLHTLQVSRYCFFSFEEQYWQRVQVIPGRDAIATKTETLTQCCFNVGSSWPYIKTALGQRLCWEWQVVGAFWFSDFRILRGPVKCMCTHTNGLKFDIHFRERCKCDDGPRGWWFTMTAFLLKRLHNIKLVRFCAQIESGCPVLC